MRLGLVILDWAGTVIDHGAQAPTAAVQKAFAARGVAVTPAEVQAVLELTPRALADALLAEPNLRWRWKHRLGKDPSEADAQRITDDVFLRLMETIPEHDALIAGVPECVEELRRRGYQVGGTTWAFREAAEAWGAAAFRQGYCPEASICGDDVPAGRPAPWMIYRLMEWLNVYPPAGVVKVSGSRVGVAEGRNAGCWSVAVLQPSAEVGLSAEGLNGLAEEDRALRLQDAGAALTRAGAHVAVQTVADVPAALEELTARLDRGERP
ncbi:MAG: phosphonoacetaldehyde hydrolase [Gemmataceae bacterium]